MSVQRLNTVSPWAPFRVPSYRFQWPSDLLTSWAFEMETIILGWYVLVHTDSVLLLTVFGSLQFIGTLLTPMLGVIADKVPRRTILYVMRAIFAAIASILKQGGYRAFTRQSKLETFPGNFFLSFLA